MLTDRQRSSGNHKGKLGEQAMSISGIVDWDDNIGRKLSRLGFALGFVQIGRESMCASSSHFISHHRFRVLVPPTRIRQSHASGPNRHGHR